MAEPFVQAEAPESEEDDDEEVDEAEVLRQQQIAAKRKGGHRASVSAERTVALEGWKPPVFDKSPEQVQQIQNALLKNFMFKALPQEKLQEVIGAFQGPKSVQPGQWVITQGAMVESGEPGLFVLESGILDVFVKRTPTDRPPGSQVLTYDKMGQSFGELALLYNCPRAATVIANTASVVWSIDRDTFNQCVKIGYEDTRRRQESFIETVEVLRGLTSQERQKVVDVIQSETYFNGNQIIKRGEEGDKFFMVETGSCMATNDGKPLSNYGPGSYFGELALIKNQPRMANVFATNSPTVCLVLDADTFRRLLGPLNELMAERAKDYIPLGVPTRLLDGSEEPNRVDKEVPILARLLGAWCGCSSISAAHPSQRI